MVHQSIWKSEKIPTKPNSRLKGLYCLAVSIITLTFILNPINVNAAAYSWYQGGQGGGPGIGYLPTPGNNAWGLAYMLNNAISSDLDSARAAGEYCNAYNSGSSLNNQNGVDNSSITGLTVGSPYSNWQEGDALSNNVCQATGSSFRGI